MDKPPFLRTLRVLAETWQAFGLYSGRHVRTLGLTPPQFDVIATLGNTDGMTVRELGEATLITKGTLTGVLDRLEDRGLVERAASPSDGRSLVVSLTAAGTAEFDRVFTAHVAHLAEAFEQQDDKARQALERGLVELRDHFRDATARLGE